MVIAVNVMVIGRTEFHRNRSNGCGDIARSTFFQNGGRAPSWIFTDTNFSTADTAAQRSTVASSWQSSSDSVKRLVRYLGFFERFSRWWPSAILDFRKFHLSVAGHVVNVMVIMAVFTHSKLRSMTTNKFLQFQSRYRAWEQRLRYDVFRVL